MPSLRRAGRVIWLVTGLLALLAASSLVSMLVALVLAIRLLRETCRAPRPQDGSIGTRQWGSVLRLCGETEERTEHDERRAGGVGARGDARGQSGMGLSDIAVARGPSDPLVENGVAMLTVCGKGRGFLQATDIAPNPQMGSWSQEKHGDFNTWYHYAPSKFAGD